MGIYDDLIKTKEEEIKEEGFFKKAARFILPGFLETPLLGEEPKDKIEPTKPTERMRGTIYDDLFEQPKIVETKEKKLLPVWEEIKEKKKPEYYSIKTPSGFVSFPTPEKIAKQKITKVDEKLEIINTEIKELEEMAKRGEGRMSVYETLKTGTPSVFTKIEQKRASIKRLEGEKMSWEAQISYEEEAKTLTGKAGRHFMAGIGDIFYTIGRAAEWIGLKSVGKESMEYGEQLQRQVVPPMNPEDFTWKKPIDPEWWATTVTRSVPFTLSLIPSAIVGAYVGAGTATAVGLGALGRTILGSLGATALSRPLESAFEAGSVYDKMLRKGVSEEEASKAADKTFKGNLALGGIDAAQFALSFTPLKYFGKGASSTMLRRIASTGAKVGIVGTSEALEEGYQESVQRWATGEEISLDPQMKEAMSIGAIFGVGLGGAGSVWNSLTTRIKNELPVDIKNQVDKDIQEKISVGVDEKKAEIETLDEIAETPEGKKSIEKTITKMKEIVEEPTAKDEVKIERSVVQVVDDTETGMAGEEIDGKKYHLTAKTPAQMEEAGFVNKGMANIDQIPKKPVSKEAEAKPISKPFTVEAKKFKNAEEFVKAQPKLYRGGDDIIDISKIDEKGISLTSDKELAKMFGDKVEAITVSKSAKILKDKDIPKELLDDYLIYAKKLSKPLDLSEASFNSLRKSVFKKQQDIVNYANKNGFDAVEFKFENELRVWNVDKIKTKSQLTDIWKKAQETIAKLKAKEQNRLETLESEKAFIERRYNRIKGLKEDLKTTRENIEEYSGELSEWGKATLRRFKMKEKTLLKSIISAKEKLKGVDVSKAKKEIQEKGEQIEIQEKLIKKIDKEFDVKIEKAKKERIEVIVQKNNYKDYSDKILSENKDFFQKTIEAKPKKRIGSIGKNMAIGSFRKDMEIKMGGIDKIRPIEFPELVELSKELTGKAPTITRRFVRSLGKFYETERGRIKLNANLFLKENQGQLAQVLSHEIGHLIDYLPHKTMARGNLLGRLFSLRKFLKGTFGEVEIKNKEIKKELIKASEYWRPYDKEKTKEAYVKYRESSRELYADAVGLLFNSPGTLESIAPNFYNLFFENLDKKPNTKEAYFDLQAILTHDRETLLALRSERTKKMFEDADYKAKELQATREKEKQFRLNDFWQKFQYSVRTVNQPIYKKVDELKSRGVHIRDEENPKYILSGRNYLSGKVKGLFEESVEPIIDEIGDNGIEWKTFGEFLLYERIISGDRSDFANPLGITPDSAKEQITFLKDTLGNNKYETLQENAEKFRNFLKDIGKEAYDVGLYSEELFNIIDGNSKYVPFQVLEYMEENVAWKTKSQVGTLKDVNNPANSLLLKSISTIRAIEQQKVKVSTFKMLEKGFKDDIQEANYSFVGKRRIPLRPRDKNLDLVIYYEKGKIKGKYVDTYIAKSLENDSLAVNKAVMTILSPLSWTNRKFFKKLFVVYNPGWIPFNAIRDFSRFWKNTPDLSFIGAVKRYGQAMRPAKVRAFMTKDGMKKATEKDLQAYSIVKKLEKDQILSVTWNDILAGQDIQDSQIEAILENVGVIEKKEKTPHIFLKPFLKILEAIRKTGDFVETIPKIAGYFELEKKMEPQEMAHFIRKNIGSPDFFEKGYLTPATNETFLFSNAITQAISADLYIMTNPKTRSGYWWKTAKSVFLPKALMFAAMMGMFGEGIKELFEDASEYDLTSYIIIPIGKDTTNGKTIYIRIPMDETGRLLGALAWKVMNGAVNEQGLAQDVSDIASLFGGQLPTFAPLLTSGFATTQMLTGQNPYDFFRGRKVLTEQQQRAGGLYALKPFLLWQFQQLGGSIFMKFYAGEQTPTQKSLGEKFLKLPFISNVIGRFVKISDYGQLQKLRDKLGTTQKEKAIASLDEKHIINKYVGKYQKGESYSNLKRELVSEILGHKPKTKDEKTTAKRIYKKFQIAIVKGSADPVVNSFISAWTNDEKLVLLRVFKESMDQKEFIELKKTLIKYKIVNKTLFTKLKK